MPTISFEDNWDLNHSEFIESTYKVYRNTSISYADQITTCLENLHDKEDQNSVRSASIICAAFGYESINVITELNVLRLTTNAKCELCLKIAALHPSSDNDCLVGTFVLDGAMNIIATQRVETLKRKVPPLPKFKVPEASWFTFIFDENKNPNIPTQTSINCDFMKSARASYRQLPISDEMLANLSAAHESTITNKC